MSLNPFSSVAVRFNESSHGVSQSSVNAFDVYSDEQGRETEQEEEEQEVNEDRLPYEFKGGDFITMEYQPYCEVVSPIGRGSFGDVYRVTLLSNGQHVALKTTKGGHHMPHEKRSEFTEELLREMSFALRLKSHPNAKRTPPRSVRLWAALFAGAAPVDGCRVK